MNKNLIRPDTLRVCLSPNNRSTEMILTKPHRPMLQSQLPNLISSPSSDLSAHVKGNRTTPSGFVGKLRSKVLPARNAGSDWRAFRCQMTMSPKVKFEEDEFYIKRAVELAKKAIGFTSPNPMVGCVIVNDGQIVGEGFHPKAGQPHAEVFALRDAGELAENATAYVSLEPCNHYGRTPPCTEALIKAKVKRVVVGMVDPNPIVASKGVEKLRNAGIEVTVGVEEELCKRLNEAYIHKMVTRKPFVTLRYTLSVNGNLLNTLGEGAGECGGYFSKLLQECDAVALPASSLENRPFLLTSQELGANQPLNILIVKDPYQFVQLSTPEHDPSNVIIFTDKEPTKETAFGRKGIETVVVERICYDSMLEYCNQQEKCSLLLDWRGELGDEYHEIIKQCVENNLVQKVVVEILPLWNENRDKLSRWGINNLKGMQRLKKLTPSLSSEHVVVLEGYF